MPDPDQSVQLLAATDPLARAADALRNSSTSQTDAEKKKKLKESADAVNKLSLEVSRHAARHSDVALRGGLASARLQEGAAKLKALSKSATDPADRKALKDFADRAGVLSRVVKNAAR